MSAEKDVTCDDRVWNTHTGRCAGRVGHDGQDASCSDCPARVIPIRRHPMTHHLPPAEAARLDAYARTMRTGMVALFLVAAMVNLIPRTPGEFPAETVSEVRR